ncbi:MAG: alpha-1,2-fucosyltransferase [Clostridiales bacterium]|nr:alpha-1,2-fucosyltransferase [Clostridiales bacterium]
MNIIRMSGGIGNQMFQYALYLKLVSLGKEVKFDDVTEYEPDNARPIMLSVFGIDYPKASKEEINEITDGSMNLVDRIRRKLFGRKSREYTEAFLGYDEEVLKKDSSYLCGYFQSEKYFKDIEKEVREAFRFRNVHMPEPIETQIKQYEEQIAGSLSISIHIRRGDYLQAEDVYGGICTDAYYEKAMEYLLEKYPSAHFFVFTNDTLWAEKWCEEKRAEKREFKFTVIKGTKEATGYIDLMLMSKCRHHIIANSSFSWWGAWLNDSPGKCVVAPEKWLNTCECHDIFTPDMVRIDAYGKIDIDNSAGL